MNLFGFEFKRQEDKEQEKLKSFVPKDESDGAVVVASGGFYGTYVDLDGSIKTESELITKYRNMSQQPEIKKAIDIIVNEAIDIEEDQIVSIDINDDENEIPEKTKEIIVQEFEEALRLLDFNNNAYDLFARWYIDGRLKYHAIVNKEKQKDGIQELRYIDPRKIRKIREIVKKPNDSKSDAELVKTVTEYYMYNAAGFSSVRQNNVSSSTAGTATSVIGIKIAKDSIVDVPSGYMDVNNTMVLSYLNSAIKPLNNLRTLEDASVIYTLVRAPQRRVWYIDTGNLPKAKADQLIRETAMAHKNRLIYDATSGEVRDDRKFMTMLEDYWLARRGDQGRGTEVTTLPPGQSMSDMMPQIEYFKKALLGSLNIPAERVADDSLFGLGRSQQITKEGVEFGKFIIRLRNKFCVLFNQILEKNLVLKQIMTPEDWALIKNKIKYKFASSTYFNELKDSEVLMDRLNTYNMIQPLIGTIYSERWVKRNVLRLSEEQIEEMNREIYEEQEEQMLRDAEVLKKSTSLGLVDDGEEDGTEGNASDDKVEKARITYNRLKQKKDRTPQEQHEFTVSAEIVAKNDPKPDAPKKQAVSKATKKYGTNKSTTKKLANSRKKANDPKL